MMVRRTLSGRHAFTLTEVLVVIAIIAVLATITIGAILGQAGRADQSATEGAINLLAEALDDRRESFLATFRPNVATTHTGLADATVTGTPTREPSTVHSNRARAIAQLDAYRSAFPQQFVDFLRPLDSAIDPRDPSYTHYGLAAAANTSGMRIAITQTYLSQTVSQASFARDNANPLQVSSAHPYDPGFAYSPIPLVRDQNGNYTTNSAPHDPLTESSECLYLIMTTALEGMESPISKLPKRFIQDTDNDGLLEFVDSWGTPLQFYRTPTDYMAYLRQVARVLPDGLIQGNPFDPNATFTRTVWFNHSSNAALDVFERGVFTGMGIGRQFFGGYFRLREFNAAGPTAGGLPGTGEIPTPATVGAPLVNSLIVSAGPDAGRLAPSERWKAFGLAWPVSATTQPLPRRVEDVDSRMGRVGGLVTYPGASGNPTFRPDYDALAAVKDNIVSIRQVAGRENK